MRCLSAIRTNGRPGPVEVYGRMVRKLPLRAVKAISCSQRNDSYGAHSGRSQGDPWRQASRPTEVSTAAVCYVRSTSIRDIAPSLKCAKSGHSRASASGPMYLLLDSSTGYDLPPRRQRRSFGGGEYQAMRDDEKRQRGRGLAEGINCPPSSAVCAGALAGAHERFKPLAFLAAWPNQVFLTAISFPATNQLHRPARRQRFRQTPPNQ